MERRTTHALLFALKCVTALLVLILIFLFVWSLVQTGTTIDPDFSEIQPQPLMW